MVIWEKPVSLLSLHSQKQLTYKAIQTREKRTVHVHESYGWFVTLMNVLAIVTLCYWSSGLWGPAVGKVRLHP